MRLPTSYFELVEGYVQAVELLASQSPADAERASREVLELSLGYLRRDGGTPERHEKIAVWHADKFYRLVNQVDELNASSLLFMRSVGAAFEAFCKERGLWVAYLVDNQAPMDRLVGLRAAFASLGFVVASPELFVEPLLAETPGAQPPGVVHEAIELAVQLFESAVDERRNVLWVSGEVPLEDLQYLAGELRGQPYVGVFRNDVPADGTEVQVFQGAGRTEALTG